jgi:hypothetical protein
MNCAQDQIQAGNECLWRKIETLRQIQLDGGLQIVCKAPHRVDDKLPPWDMMPSDGRPLNLLQSILLSTVGTTAVAVLNYTVPTGYDGILNQLVFSFTGEGFVEGSGNLQWQLKIDQYYAYNYGNFLFSLSDIRRGQTAVEGGGIRFYSNQRLSWLVTRPNAPGDGLGPNTSRLIAGGSGWIYPVR